MVSLNPLDAEIGLSCAWIGFETLATPLAFQNPSCVVVARTISDVVPALRLVESLAASGLHAVGQVAYEAAPAFEAAMRVQSVTPLCDFPLLWFALFDPAELAASPNGGNSPISASSQPSKPGRPPLRNVSEANSLGDAADCTASFTIGHWQPDTARTDYDSAIGSIRNSIRNGDCYQVNHTIRLRSQFQGSDVTFLSHLLAAQRCGYGAYLHLGRYRILSASPEQFFHWKRATGEICSRPMKGTRKRGLSSAQDAIERAALLASTKDRAENLMIVDLLRNDIGRIAVKGTVGVRDMFKVESYPTVLQMTSTVHAVTKPDISLVDVMKALFPCGSITGAPKISAMNVISALESSSRATYCGAIMHIGPGPHGAVSASVPIRTVILDTETGTAHYGVGGGITWGSTAAGEYEEVLAKAAVLHAAAASAASTASSNSSGTSSSSSASANTSILKSAGVRGPFQLLETMRMRIDAAPRTVAIAAFAPAPEKRWDITFLQQHLGRLQASAAYFGYRYDAAAVFKELETLAGELTSGQHYRVRLLLDSAGNNSAAATSIAAAPVDSTAQLLLTVLADSPVSSSDVFLYHKTSNRSVYDAARAVHCGDQHHPALTTASKVPTTAGAASSATDAPTDAGTTQSNDISPPSTLSDIVEPVFDVLLYNERGEVTEFCIGNIVVELPVGSESAAAADASIHHCSGDVVGDASSGSALLSDHSASVDATASSTWPRPSNGHAFFTPPVHRGLLPGAFRDYLLSSGYCGIAERVLTIDNVLNTASRVWLVNSVREWVPVRVLDRRRR